MNESVNVLLFGITRDITGHSTLQCALPAHPTVDDLLAFLKQQYPELVGIRSLLVAVNGEYAESDAPLTAHDEIAIIPPVSGG